MLNMYLANGYSYSFQLSFTVSRAFSPIAMHGRVWAAGFGKVQGGCRSSHWSFNTDDALGPL